MEKCSTFGWLEVHRGTIDVSVAEEGSGGDVRHYGTTRGEN
jgi:hypothetical protein